MKILPVTDPSFQNYGQILTGYDVKELLETLDKVTPLPEGVAYVAEQPELMALPIEKELRNNAYGGMPIQIGWCNGHNTKLNCLEYHRDSELNVGVKDFILLLAKREELENGVLDTAKVAAFCVPAGVLVEVYATTLHYAPCNAAKDAGFKTIVVLPKGTNLDKPEITVKNEEDEILWASNKWLLAHADSSEAAQGAKVLLKGENTDIASLL
ncbi:MAG: DUF4867 family protein [Clostridia bacterium]|nr:DUF4867 family protein [Clostridia bacterium]MBQ6722612.1 DUF4867 family protein [Clostridia bacterium]